MIIFQGAETDKVEMLNASVNISQCKSLKKCLKEANGRVVYKVIGAIEGVHSDSFGDHSYLIFITEDGQCIKSLSDNVIRQLRQLLCNWEASTKSVTIAVDRAITKDGKNHYFYCQIEGYEQ